MEEGTAMLNFDNRDFTRSALSLAGGMLGMSFIAGWRSGWEIQAMSLTLGLPLGVVAFWAIYSWRMRRLQQELGFGKDLPPIIAVAARTPAAFYPKLLHRGVRELTLEAARLLPRFRKRSRTATLSWESQDQASNRDQWHM